MTLNLITDRTEGNVQRARYLNSVLYSTMTNDEKEEWDAGVKGAYNFSDLNRVESAVRYIADRFDEIGYPVYVETKTNWTHSDVPTTEDFTRYLENVKKIRSKLVILQTTPQVPDDMERLLWNEANDIERVLWDVEILIESMRKIILRTKQPLLHPGHAVYMMENQGVALFAKENPHLYSSEGLPLYSAEGLELGASGAVPLYTVDGIQLLCAGGSPIYIDGKPVNVGGIV